MCRYYQLWGSILVAFGFGILIGIWIEGGFFSHCLGFLLMIIGFGIGRKK